VSGLAAPAPVRSRAEAGDDAVADAAVDAAMAGDDDAFTVLVDRYRREVHGHCLRMLRSYEQAEDVVQETFFRAWRGRDGFAGRAAFRTWLFQIATNACLDEISKSARRPEIRDARPTGAGAPDAVVDGLHHTKLAATPVHAQPDAVVVANETIELGLASAFALLPPKQRAALILRDVLRWSAGDTATLLGTTVASVNSALQRARTTLEARRPSRDAGRPAGPALDADDRRIAQHCVDALVRADWATLIELVRADAARANRASAPAS
jgi:RNA polymerase sigma-70 factor, ECF subfamily